MASTRHKSQNEWKIDYFNENVQAVKASLSPILGALRQINERIDEISGDRMDGLSDDREMVRLMAENLLKDGETIDGCIRRYRDKAEVIRINKKLLTAGPGGTPL